MKKYILIILFTGISIYGNAQCTLTINPQGPTTFCNGDSLELIASATGSASVVDQKDTVYNSGMSARNLPGYSFWQSFTAGITGTLNQIDIGFFNNINGVGTLKFYSGTGTGGTLLDSHAVNVSCPSGSCLLGFTENISITAGNIYTLDFIPGTGMPDPYGVQVDIPGSYPGGTFALVDPSGTYPQWDLVFKTHVASQLHYHWSTGGTDSILEVHSSGTYRITVTDSVNCTVLDSINVTVNSVDTSVHETGIVLTSNATSATYQWVNCTTNYSPINGATNQSFTPSFNGDYAVIVTQNGCTDTSNCRSIFTVGLETISLAKGSVIFPNPSTGKFTINMDTISGQIYSIEISNVLGKIIYSDNEIKKKSVYDIDISSVPSGIYFLKIIDDSTIQTLKIIIR
jgi:hypothetical protein